MSRCWLLVACLALCLAESGLAASFAEEDPVSPTLAPYADSIAASLVKVAPPQRLARWTSTRETRQVREQGRLFEEVADTLGDDLLFAVHQFGSQGIEMRLVERSGWRRVEMPPPPADPEARHDRAHAVPMQLVFGRARDLPSSEPARVAVLWSECGGTSAPHSFELVAVDPLGAGPQRQGAGRLPQRFYDRSEKRGLEVLRKHDEILLRTRSDWNGTSTFDANFCGACPHLAMESVWRVNARDATLLRQQPLDDAAFAVMRAFDRLHGLDPWEHDDPVSVAPRLQPWLRASRAVALYGVWPRNNGEARVVLLRAGSRNASQARIAEDDTLGIEVRRAYGPEEREWSLR